MFLKGDCLLSPESTFNVQHLQHDQGREAVAYYTYLYSRLAKASRGPLKDLDIYVTFTLNMIRNVEIYICTDRNLNMELIDIRLQKIIQEYTVL